MSEDECLAAAVAMLDASSARGDSSDFVMRASAMLAALFRAAALEGVPGLLYARQAARHDLLTVAHRLQDLDPALAVQLLAADPDSKWQDDRFLRSTWGYAGHAPCATGELRPQSVRSAAPTSDRASCTPRPSR